MLLKWFILLLDFIIQMIKWQDYLLKLQIKWLKIVKKEY